MEFPVNGWIAPAIPENIKHGDMPGDKVEIGEDHIKKAGVIFPALTEMINTKYADQDKIVLCVCGGSGVGKSEIASLLSFYFESMGIGSYTLSGDNYPRRIPMYNDAERLHIFREGGLKRMMADGNYTPERFDMVYEWQKAGTDADPAYIEANPWFASYIEGGKEALTGYLGTDKEQNFDDIQTILDAFHAGQEKIWLKRMGRTDVDLWYEAVDFSEVKVLIIEWTHGNNDGFTGVDLPIFLNSTPAETLAHRRARNRDGKTDSAFTTMVLGIEQRLLHSQAHKAAIILSKAAEILSFAEYSELMAKEM